MQLFVRPGNTVNQPVLAGRMALATPLLEALYTQPKLENA
jgi:hypothetical protein